MGCSRQRSRASDRKPGIEAMIDFASANARSNRGSSPEITSRTACSRIIRTFCRERLTCPSVADTAVRGFRRLRTAHWSMRVEIHVRPSASRAAVGGQYGGALIVRVVEPAHAGRATDAALRAVAKAFGIPRGSVRLIRGAASRRKLIEIDVPTDQVQSVATALHRLRSDGDDQSTNAR